MCDSPINVRSGCVYFCSLMSCSSPHHWDLHDAPLVEADDTRRFRAWIAPQVRQAVEQRVDARDHLGARDVHAEAHVRSATEAERRLERTDRVVLVGPLEPLWITVGRAEAQV